MSYRNLSRRALVLTTAVALAGLAAPRAASAADVFKIGLIANYSGAFAVWGPQFQNAIEAYQAIYGKTVKGPKGEDIEVQIIPRDAASGGPEKAKQLAEELVLREKVKMLTGFDLSPHAMAVADISKQAKIPVVIMNAATSSITRASPYYVRTSYTMSQWASSIGGWAARNGIKRVFLMTSDFAPGHDAAEYFTKAFTAGGGTIVGHEKTPLQETNFSVYMEKAMQAKPDAIYIMQPGGSPSIGLVKAYSERGLAKAGIKLLGNGEFAELYLPNFNDDVIGVITVGHYTESNDRPENQKMRAQLTKMFGAKGATDIATVAAWDAMQLIYLALHTYGANAEGLQYIEAMKGKEMTSPRGTFVIDPEERDVIHNIYIRRLEKKDGKLVNVEIETIGSVKDQWKIDHPVQK